MSWFRLDDDGTFHPKVVRAGNDAYGAWCRAGQWCGKHSQNGKIPLAIAHMIAKKSVWEKLRSVGLLDPCEGDQYEIHDFNRYNPTAEQAEQKRAARASAGAAGGQKSGDARRSKGEAKREAIASAKPKHVASPGGEAKTNPDPDPDPVPKREERENPAEPGPTPSTKTKPGRRPLPKVLLDEDFSPSPEMLQTIERCDGVPPNVALACVADFVRYWTVGEGAGQKRRDWPSTFHNRIKQLKSWNQLPDAPAPKPAPVAPRPETRPQTAEEREVMQRTFDMLNAKLVSENGELPRLVGA